MCKKEKTRKKNIWMKENKNNIKNKKSQLRNAITIFLQKILSNRLLVVNIDEEKINFLWWI